MHVVKLRIVRELYEISRKVLDVNSLLKLHAAYNILDNIGFSFQI